MKKRQKKSSHLKRHHKSVEWLPVDSTLFPFFSFSHVKGIARIFLIIEIIMSVTVVAGTVVLAIARWLSVLHIF